MENIIYQIERKLINLKQRQSNSIAFIKEASQIIDDKYALILAKHTDKINNLDNQIMKYERKKIEYEKIYSDYLKVLYEVIES